MDSALSPNTAAFLNYLSGISSFPGPDDTTAYPPSTFFPMNTPVPGRDTPEDTPPSAAEADAEASPELLQGLSEDSDGVQGGKGSGNKRKAGGPKVVDGDEDGTYTDSSIIVPD